MAGDARGLPTCKHGLRNPSAAGKGMAGKCADWVARETVDYGRILSNFSKQATKLRAGGATAEMMSHIEHVRRHGAAPGMGGGSAPDAMSFLEHAILWLSEMQPGQPIRTVETGFAHGFSAVSIVGAACATGISVKHTAMDPYQSAWWKGFGQKNMKSIVQKCPSNDVTFEQYELPAAVGLAKMYERSECIQLAYMDDGHRFVAGCSSNKQHPCSPPE